MLHTADVHIGTRLFRGHEGYEGLDVEVFREIAERAIELGCRVLAVSGDLFDTNAPRELPSASLLGAASVLRRLRERGVAVVATPGNHDFHRDRQGVLELFEESGLLRVPRFRVGEALELEPLEVDGVAFYAVPGMRNSAEVEYIASGRVLAKRAAAERVVVLAHTLVDHPLLSSPGLPKWIREERKAPLSALERPFGRVSYFALGHVHYPVPPDREFSLQLAYPGAPLGYNHDDLLQSAALRRAGLRRRALAVDLSSDPPRARSVELETPPEVEVVRSDSPRLGFEEARSLVAEALSKMGGRRRVVVLWVREGALDAQAVDRLKALAAREGAYLHVREGEREEQYAITTVEVRQVQDLLEKERELLAKLLPKYGLGLDPGRVQKIITAIAEGGNVEDAIREIMEAID